MTMTANKNASATRRPGGNKVPRDTLDRCQSVSPPPLLYQPRSPTSHPLSDSEDSCHSSSFTQVSNARPLLKDRTNWGITLRSTSTSSSDTESPNHLLKAVSIGCLDKRLSFVWAEEPKEVTKEAQDGEAVGGRQLTQSTLSLGTSANLRNLSLSRVSVHSQALGIRQKISEWECRREAPPRMNVCLDKRDAGDWSGSESCPSMLPSPCSEKTFEYKGFQRMSRTFSECSYPETEEEEFLDRDSCHRLEKRPSRSQPSNAFLKGNARKESSAVLNRIQKIEQVLKEQPGRGLPQLPSSCYSVESGKKKPVTLGILEALTENVNESKVGKGVTRGNSPETPSEKTSKALDGLHTADDSVGPQLLPENLGDTVVNPVPKPKRTFEYEADKNHKSKPSNGLPPSPLAAVPPPLPSTPAPPVTRRQKKESRFHRKSQNRKSFEFEDASSLQTLYPPSPSENGTETPQHKLGSKSTLEENAYEDIVGDSPKENPYEDVELKARNAGRKSQQLSESSLDSLHRMWTPQDRKYTTPPQVNIACLRKTGLFFSLLKSHRLLRLPKRHSHDDMLLLAQLGIPSSPSSLNEDSLSTTSELLSTRRARRVPKLVQRINSIYSAKRGKKRLKKLSMSNIETASLRDENSESESDSDDRFKAHTQRLVHIQSMLKRAPSYRTLELELIEWQERELFEYFVVVSLKKKPSKNTFVPEVTYQFPKLERPTKQVREAEERLKAIPQFCFPDAKDWNAVSEYNSETFSFMLTGDDGSRRFGYCRRLLPSGKGPRLPEVYCVISRLGCFDLFSKILDEVERRRGISAALVYPFMRSLMESPFPAPGKTIRVKTFLPGSGNEVIELRRPMDSRLEHVDFECLFRCLSIRQIIRIFASLLLERRVIFIADKLSTLSSCSHAVVALLYPFSWQHTFIPVLPSSMIDIVCCPTPFLVGLLSSSLPKLKELPVEEALMVNLGSDRFIRQMDDEDTLLPRKLQAALEQALERKNDLINQDSDSESDEECNTLNGLVSEVFIRFFVETIGHYSLFLTQNEKAERSSRGRVFANL
ncbi:hypothetical protein JRQ81_000394 [Phrynocephalus forsythii]|uniref:UDENN domain-containing protein n=1 Tax=Phrynocephalus forsythii TaxID=171643 RepID=A0A9Q1B807_9SAUR|nr:hypothetical protein JRQ81_000394 [Phrynocephalus forsythii]